MARVLKEREPPHWADAERQRRAAAHKLLDALAAGLVDATPAEIDAALRATGDLAPLVRARRGLGFVTPGTQQEALVH